MRRIPGCDVCTQKLRLIAALPIRIHLDRETYLEKALGRRKRNYRVDELSFFLSPGRLLQLALDLRSIYRERGKL